MEPENSENWSQPNENQNQPDTCPPSEQKSFFQQECLQRTWLDVKLATWLKCLIVIVVFSVAAAVISPKFTPAETQQQETQETFEYNSESDEYDCYGDSEYYSEEEYYTEDEYYSEDEYYDDDYYYDD
jgi:hypothetical protein